MSTLREVSLADEVLQCQMGPLTSSLVSPLVASREQTLDLETKQYEVRGASTLLDDDRCRHPPPAPLPP